MIRAAIGYMGAKRIFTSTNNISIAYQQKDKATKPKLPIPRGFRHRPFSTNLGIPTAPLLIPSLLE
jgi:hypothetical protein